MEKSKNMLRYDRGTPREFDVFLFGTRCTVTFLNHAGPCAYGSNANHNARPLDKKLHWKLRPLYATCLASTVRISS